MSLTKSRKFNQFISERRDEAYRILAKRYCSSFSDADIDDIFQKSAIVLYEKIDSGNLTKLKCRIKSDGVESVVERPVLADDAKTTLKCYFIEILHRQALKEWGKKNNNQSDTEKKREEKNLELAKEWGMSLSEFTEMLNGSTGHHKADVRIKKEEIDAEISDGKLEELSKACESADNSMYRDIMLQALETLPTRCRDLLSYYSQKIRWADIAAKFGIEGGANSAKSSASQCRKTLSIRCHELERKYYE